MKGIYHISLAWATGILITGAISCGSKADTKVWTVDQQLHTTDGIYRINGVCYHPVAIGDSVRSFSNLSQDLRLMNDLGSTPSASMSPLTPKRCSMKSARPECASSWVSVTTRAAPSTSDPERSLNMSKSSRTIPLFWCGNWAMSTTFTPSGLGVISKRGTVHWQLPLMPSTRKTQTIR